ncbi:MAG: L,D-transpeptidase, partial [Chloroflexi bacterium]|nr:L,D-transpeptidase [Chloroflexota bacterium]
LFLWNQLQSPTAVRAQLPDAQQAAILPEQLPVNKAPKAAEHTATPKPLVPAKQIGDNTTDDPRPTWTITPTPTPTFTPTPTWVPTFVSSRGQTYSTRPHGVGADEKWIDVNISTQTLRAYIGNDMVFSTLISSGTAEFPTVTGQFRIWLSYESQTMDGRLLGYDYYLENVPYVMYFYNDYALHGTFWHNNFGNPMSHGCVNLKTGDAGWIYSWASIGTLVNVHK